MLGEIIIHAVFFCVMLFLYFVASTFPLVSIGGSLGAAWWPHVVLGAGMIFTVLSLFFSLRKAKAGIVDPKKKKGVTKKEIYGLLVSSGIIVVGLLLVNYLGFFGIAPLLVFGFLYVLGSKKPWVWVVASLVIAIIFTVVFGKFMEVSLPRGIGFMRNLSYLLY